MTIDSLTTLVESTMTAYHAQEEQRVQRVNQTRQECERHAQEQLLARLQEVLTPDFFATVKWQFDCRWQSNYTSYTVSAFFPYLALDWHISGMSNAWSIYVTKPGQSSPWRTKATNITNEELQATLLLELGKHLEEVQQKEAERATQLRLAEQEQKQRVLQEEQIAAEQARAVAAAEALHQRLEKRVAEAVAQAKRELWRWPEGVTIEIYTIKYCDGSGRNEDGDQCFDYVTGWTATSALDEKCRIRLEPTMAYAWSTHASKAQVVQLMPEIHRPIWTVYTFSSTEELPDALLRPVDASVPGIVKRIDYATDSVSRFVEITQSELNYEEEWYTHRVGMKPLKWIRDLVEQQKGEVTHE